MVQNRTGFLSILWDFSVRVLWIDSNDFITQNYRNNTNIACSLTFVNKIFLFLPLFSVLFFLWDNVSRNIKHFLVSMLFSSAILVIPLAFLKSLLVSITGDVEINPVPNRNPNEAHSIYRWNLNSISLKVASFKGITWQFTNLT